MSELLGVPNKKYCICKKTTLKVWNHAYLAYLCSECGGYAK